MHMTIKTQDGEIVVLKEEISTKVSQYEQLASDMERLSSMMHQHVTVRHSLLHFKS